jgi:hypothetical protein
MACWRGMSQLQLVNLTTAQYRNLNRVDETVFCAGDGRGCVVHNVKPALSMLRA